LTPDDVGLEDRSVTNLKDKTLFITGASRGIGLAIALRAARDGANIVIASKTSEPHPKLPGTIHTAAEEIERAGGRALPLSIDIRDEDQIQRGVSEAVAKFGGIDILVNNASAISLTDTISTPMKRYDLMHQVNVRGTFACSQACIPHLKKAKNPHILNNSPPLNMAPKWFKNHVAYTMAKYGMSMCVLGMAEELASDGIAVNAIWPRTTIATAAMKMVGGDEALRRCRKPEIMADAAHWILTQDSKKVTGNFFIDEEVLARSGITDFAKYAVDSSVDLIEDFFLG
jgi:citronellol/citronellal dehydrogenase